MTEYARLVLAVDSTSAKKATDDLRKLDAQSSRTEQAAGGLASAFKPLAAVFATFKVGQFIKESTLLSSRYGELGIVMEVVGRNAGYSKGQLDELEASLKKTGISAIESRNNIARMISANIDLSKATDLARLAQDSAVVGGINSSEAFERLVRGIQSAEVETLRNIGINVNFQKSYDQLAKSIGKTTDDLTEQEKVQARVNGTLAAAPNLAGAYAASLDNAGKQLRSSTRYLEDLQVQLGETFQPGFEAGVTAYAESLKFLSNNVEGAVQVLETGLYVAIARGTAVVATNTAALVAQSVQQARSNALTAEAAAFEVRKASASKASALAELEKARATEAAAIAALAQTRANQQLFAVQVALAKGTAEYAALSRGLSIVDKELAASEQAVAVATANRAAATTAAAAATGTLTKATVTASAANTAAAATATISARALTGVAAVGGRLLGLLGGPVGLALSIGAVALSFVDFSDDADDAKVSADALTGSVNQLGDAADRARARFAGLLGDVSKLNKAELQVRTNELESQLTNAEKQLKSFERQFERGVGSQGQIDGAKAAIKTLSDELSRLGKERAAQASAETKDGKRYIDRLNEQRALLGAVTEQERVRAQIREGLIKVSPEEEKKLLSLAKEVDAYNESTKAAEESARAGKQSSEEKRRASAQLLDSFTSVEVSMEKQIALFGLTSESARVRYEIENGELSKLNKAQQERLQGLAVELDRLEQIKKNREEAEATKEFTAALEDQLRARQNAIDIEVKAIGLGDKQADQLREINQLEFEYAKRLEDLARAQGTSNALTEQAYAARVEALRAAMEEEVRIVEEGARRKDEAESDWLKGAAGALQDYVNEANNGAAQMRDAVKNALQESEDAVFNFAKTGKLSFKDLVNSINDDLLRIGSKQIVASAAEGLSGALGGLFSSGSGAGMAGLFSSFAGLFDSGGNIPSGQFGIVGERGPEIVRGPVSVTGREDTAKMLGNRTNNTSVQLVFPNASTSKDVREAAATGARKITGILKSTARFN